MRVVAIVQARMGSTRMPNKVMKLINGVPMIELLLSRLSNANEINKIVLATSDDPKNISMINHLQALGYCCEQGSEDDVLDRFIKTARQSKADIIVRIT